MRAPRYQRPLPISSDLAESAVHKIMITRMAKNQQMRWSNKGTHRLALVRVADPNKELSESSRNRDR